MCGFSGIINKSRSNNLLIMQRSLARMKHRGPDDSDIKKYRINENEIILGHVRLSIIDLSESGRQPMEFINGNWTIAFNGEIYNYKEIRKELEFLGYRFKTETDTEVLLSAWIQWRENCLRKINGMFAFAILDHLAGEVTCVRDAFGIKPLYYYQDKESISFSSEIDSLKELISVRLKMNQQRAYDYLVHNDYENGDSTFYESVHNLPSGSLIKFDINKQKINEIKKWWKPIIQEKDWSLKQAVEYVREEFIENVKFNLRSDVPIGVALSGGIDSSAVACVMRYLEKDIHIRTFSYIAADSKINEEYWIKCINSHINAESVKVKIDGRNLLQDIDDMIAIQGEPFGGTSIYASYKIFQAAKAYGTKVILEGQGADEILAGYDGYPGHRMISLLETGDILEALKFLKNTSTWPNRNVSMILKYMTSELTKGSLYELLRNIDGKSSLPSWINRKYLNDNGIQSIKPRMIFAEKIRGRRVISELALSLSERGIRSLLRHGDRNAMRFSVENRVPFLTLDFTEALLSMPEEYLISKSGQTKNIFREAMKDIVPKEVIYRKDKIGFETPEKKWIINESKTIREWLNADLNLPFINRKEIISNFDEMVSGKRKYNSVIWRWINFYRWHTIKMGG